MRIPTRIISVELELFQTLLFLELKHKFFKLHRIVLAKAKSQPVEVLRMFLYIALFCCIYAFAAKNKRQRYYVYGLAVRPLSVNN